MRCPKTAALLDSIPGMSTAMFSILTPGTRIAPHRGPFKGVLRYHLGLVVPPDPEHCAIRVAEETRSWQEGRGLVFDDTNEHEAWNETADPRVVLFVDFIKPLRFPASALNRLLLRLAVFTPYLREGHDNLRNWERRFHAKPRCTQQP